MAQPPKLGLRLLVSDATFRAIGHVAAQWAVLEIEIDATLELLLRHPGAQHLIPQNMPQSFDRRARLLKQCAHALLADQKEIRNELIEIINASTSLRKERDEVVHGHWHIGRRKGEIAPAVTVIKRRPTVSAKMKNMSVQRIETIAGNISWVSARLMWWRELNISYG